MFPSSERNNNPGQVNNIEAVKEVESYKYQALPSNKHIRRLILEPDEGTSSLCGTLEIVDIRDAWYTYPYEAISYVWGSDTTDQVIFLDGKVLPITTSLRDALRQTRYKHKRRALWADSVCINQSDNQEKEFQVGMMGQIYETSNCTLICPGASAVSYRSTHEERSEASDVLESCRAISSRGPNVIPKLEWREAWTTMLQLGWFKRGWVIQEAALGPHCYLLWEGIEIAWVDLLQAYRCYVLSTPWEIPENLSPLHYSVTTTLNMLHYIRRQEVTDPKDRIYATMALPTSDTAMPAMEPDYRKGTSHLDVYRDFAIKYLRKNSDLDILSFVEPQDKMPDKAQTSDSQVPPFPSWVPRWDCGREVYSWFDPSNRKTMERDGSGTCDQPLFVLLDESTTLSVRGLVFDSIKYVSQEIVRHSNPSTAVDQVISIWEAMEEQRALYSSYLSRKSGIGLAFLDALGFGASESDESKWLESQDAFAQSLESGSLKDRATQSRDALMVSKFVTDKSHHRRMALLGRGYHAVTPKTAREGDACVIINGTRLPLILRKTSGSGPHYTVVGPAWVQSRKTSPVTDRPMRLGETEECDDWNELGLHFEDIFLH